MFVARFSVNRDASGRPVFNSSIVRLDRQGRELEQYGFGPKEEEREFTTLALSDDGSRLFAVDVVDGMLCVWRVSNRETGDEVLKAGEAPFITPMQIIAGMQGQEGKKAGRAFAPVKGQALPASVFVVPEEQQ